MARTSNDMCHPALRVTTRPYRSGEESTTAYRGVVEPAEDARRTSGETFEPRVLVMSIPNPRYQPPDGQRRFQYVPHP